MNNVYDGSPNFHLTWCDSKPRYGIIDMTKNIMNIYIVTNLAITSFTYNITFIYGIGRSAHLVSSSTLQTLAVVAICHVL